MTPSFDLNALLAGHVFAFMMLLSRVGGVIMLFPGIGEPYVPPRIRMMLALMISLLLMGPLMARIPPMPANPAAMTALIAYEVIIGLFFGTLLRLIISALEAAGMIVGLQTGLSNATVLNPALAAESPLPAAFLSTAGLVLVFATGLDHFLIRSIAGLYDLFPPGGPFLPGDMAQTVIAMTNRSFGLGIELAAPFFIMGLLLYTALGIVQRLMPNVQIFMVSMPIQIWGGLAMFALTSSLMLALWLKFFDQSVAALFQS